MAVDTGARATSRSARFLRHWFVHFAIMFVALLALYAGAQTPFLLIKILRSRSLEWALVIWECLAAVLILVAYLYLVRWLERRPVTELALRPALAGLLWGSMIGFALFALAISILVALGHGVVSFRPPFVFPTIALSLSIISGVAEELLFRGAMFRIVENRFGTLMGLLVSAGFFGLVHIGNPGATATSSAAIALEAGLLLALAFTATRTLWLPIGLHFAWNFTEGGVFGTEVSGGKMTGLLQTTLSGPEIVTGGIFGPEASIVAVILCVAAATLFLVVTIRRGHWRSFSLREAGNLGRSRE